MANGFYSEGVWPCGRGDEEEGKLILNIGQQRGRVDMRCPLRLEESLGQEISLVLFLSKKMLALPSVRTILRVRIVPTHFFL